MSHTDSINVEDDCCELRADDSRDSVDTASLTNDVSLVSSFSSDSAQDDIPLSSPCSDSYSTERLRQRREYSKPEFEDCLKQEFSLRKPSRQSGMRRQRYYAMFTLLFVAFLCFGCILTSREHSSGWNTLSKKRTAKLLAAIRKRHMPDNLSLLLTGSHVDLIIKSLDRHTQCSVVGSVYVNYISDDEDERLPESILEHPSRKVADKWMPNSDAVFLLDESVKLSCNDLERALREWNLDRTTAVGYIPVTTEGSYSLLSNQALCVHRLYLKTAPDVKDRCESIALSAWVAYVSKKPPVAMQLSGARIFVTDDVEQSWDETCISWFREASGLGKIPINSQVYVGRRR